jgi:hypothetical protein
MALFVLACATGGIDLPEKYNLDNQLESVSYISKYQGYTSWDAIDNQSFILQTSPSSYYLLILQIPATELRFSESIRISSSGSRVRAGMDTVTLLGRSIKGPPYMIEKIYRLKGREQVQTIREQIRALK